MSPGLYAHYMHALTPAPVLFLMLLNKRKLVEYLHHYEKQSDFLKFSYKLKRRSIFQ